MSSKNQNFVINTTLPDNSRLTLKRQNVNFMYHMPNTKRATIYFDESLHKALRVKAAETDQNVSDLVNTAVRKALAEDEGDLATFRARAKEPTLAFEDLVRDLKRRGKL